MPTSLSLNLTPGPPLPPEAADAPMYVQIPHVWADFFQHKGPLPQAYEDQRRYPRYYYRGQAVMETSGRYRKFLTKDLSRGGVGFYVHEQIFPLKEIRIWLPGEGAAHVRVVRCVRVNDQCYECGAVFILEEDRAAALRQIAKVLAGS